MLSFHLSRAKLSKQMTNGKSVYKKSFFRPTILKIDYPRPIETISVIPCSNITGLGERNGKIIEFEGERRIFEEEKSKHCYLLELTFKIV